jgi:alpha-tubulin suppressor-like RCC1 family protein
LSDTHLYCWGFNSVGQLGIGDVLSHCDASDSAPVCIARVNIVPDPTLKGGSVALGYAHTCAISSNGELRCWGDNQYGAVGIGYVDPSNQSMLYDAAAVPVTQPCPKGQRYLAVTAGSVFTCALTSEGAVRCWGYNDSGQLGLGDKKSRGGELPGQTSSTWVDLGN